MVPLIDLFNRYRGNQPWADMPIERARRRFKFEAIKRYMPELLEGFQDGFMLEPVAIELEDAAAQEFETWLKSLL